MTLKIEGNKIISMAFISRYVPLSNLFLFEQSNDDDLQLSKDEHTFNFERRKENNYPYPF